MDHLLLWEFPVGMILATLLVVALARKPRAALPPPPVEWRKHRQVVRELPDPEARRLRAPLDAWIERGDHADAAVDVLALAARADDAARAQLAEAAQGARTPKRRLALMRSILTRPLNAPDNEGA